MSQYLLISIRMYGDGLGTARYHGVCQSSPEWPPSPGRVFQALVAGAAHGNMLPDRFVPALECLESLSPPVIGAPSRKLGQRVTLFVPNNDADSLSDPRDVSGIRAKKIVQPSMFAEGDSLLYAWSLSSGSQYVSELVEAANGIYQLGRGVDMAWATAELIQRHELEKRLVRYSGAIYNPCDSGTGTALDCPQSGTLQSLITRYRANSQRIKLTAQGKKLFAQAPKPRFRAVSYNSPTTHLLFELRDSVKADSPFVPWPLARTVELVQSLRGGVNADGEPVSGAAQRLWDSLPTKRDEVASVLIGRMASEADKRRRLRILPLPSIGHEYVNRDIRRVLVEVPPNCPLRKDDIAWAFSGLDVSSSVDQVTGEVLSSTRLVPASERAMLRHFAIGTGDSARIWRSVTPVVLPQNVARQFKTKSGEVRIQEELRASQAIHNALRHAGIRACVDSVRVQREPFSGRGIRVEEFAVGARFTSDRLWHVELRFAEPVSGPLCIGDGRYLGLGLLAPARESIGVLAYRIDDGLTDSANPEQLARALRRATMARVQAQIGKEPLKPFFTGHTADGAPMREGNHRHLAFVADLLGRRLMIVAPHVLEGREPDRNERANLELLDRSMQGMCVLKAGVAGRLELEATSIDLEQDPLFGRAKTWESVTVYRPTRHAKNLSPESALLADVLSEIERRRLPRPEVQVLTLRTGPRGGIEGKIRLHFHAAESGPIILGRTRHLGGGLFRRC